MLILDYGRSFLAHTGPANAVRFWVESRTLLTTAAGGPPQVFLQCGSCKSEDTFADRNLFLDPNYDFLPVFGPGGMLLFRHYDHDTGRYRELRGESPTWGQPIPRLRERVGRELPDYDAVRAATMAGLPLVAHTELWDDATGQRAILEYPVKTMNLADHLRRFQVDTGPLAMPDLSRQHDPPLAGVSLAFVAWHSPGFADFVVEQTVAVPAGQGATLALQHYARPVSRPARNRLFAFPPD